MSRSTTSRYLERYAEPLAQPLPRLFRPVRHAVCIPACNEDERFLETLESLSEIQDSDETLLILLVNGSEEAEEAVHEQNDRFLSRIRSLVNLDDGERALGRWHSLQVLLIDRASPGRRLPAKQGVGLARKLAGDLALALYQQGQILSPWMACTDADVQLPRDYLSALPPDDAPYCAALYPFEHVPEGGTDQQTAMQEYECFLHYFVLGMRWAGSPYAYHSIGSSFAVHMDCYAAVRGFPRRLAAEDFYLLNKLIKLKPLVQLPSQAIRIRGRESDRVPFGTGRAVRDIQAASDAYRVYDPRVFEALGVWVRAQAAFAANPEDFDWSTALVHPELPDGLLLRCLRHQGAIDAAHQAARQATPGDRLHRRLFEWNDAFRSLRLIHLLRDHGFASLPLADALSAAPFVPEELANRPLDALWRGLVRAVKVRSATPIGRR